MLQLAEWSFRLKGQEELGGGAAAVSGVVHHCLGGAAVAPPTHRRAAKPSRAQQKGQEGGLACHAGRAWRGEGATHSFRGLRGNGVGAAWVGGADEVPQ